MSVLRPFDKLPALNSAVLLVGSAVPRRPRHPFCLPAPGPAVRTRLWSGAPRLGGSRRAARKRSRSAGPVRAAAGPGAALRRRDGRRVPGRGAAPGWAPLPGRPLTGLSRPVRAAGGFGRRPAAAAGGGDPPGEEELQDQYVSVGRGMRLLRGGRDRGSASRRRVREAEAKPRLWCVLWWPMGAASTRVAALGLRGARCGEGRCSSCGRRSAPLHGWGWLLRRANRAVLRAGGVGTARSGGGSDSHTVIAVPVLSPFGCCTDA